MIRNTIFIHASNERKTFKNFLEEIEARYEKMISRQRPEELLHK